MFRFRLENRRHLNTGIYLSLRLQQVKHIKKKHITTNQVIQYITQDTIKAMIKEKENEHQLRAERE